ncbi:hypothetical protein GCM10008956_37040 [Deinococcus arenae]|uniref:Uncharacterized protein n=1 Tax=Deinococcus arenae TaxID=1452751 RepID=A0A8H9GYI0_9DEIO|nr:hypothetical protein GCM10008956_37040 [Deinococcus arenae]
MAARFLLNDGPGQRDEGSGQRRGLAELVGSSDRAALIAFRCSEPQASEQLLPLGQRNVAGLSRAFPPKGAAEKQHSVERGGVELLRAVGGFRAGRYAGQSGGYRRWCQRVRRGAEPSESLTACAGW